MMQKKTFTSITEIKKTEIKETGHLAQRGSCKSVRLRTRGRGVRHIQMLIHSEKITRVCICILPMFTFARKFYFFHQQQCSLHTTSGVSKIINSLYQPYLFTNRLGSSVRHYSFNSLIIYCAIIIHYVKRYLKNFLWRWGYHMGRSMHA